MIQQKLTEFEEDDGLQRVEQKTVIVYRVKCDLKIPSGPNRSCFIVLTYVNKDKTIKINILFSCNFQTLDFCAHVLTIRIGTACKLAVDTRLTLRQVNSVWSMRRARTRFTNWRNCCMPSAASPRRTASTKPRSNVRKSTPASVKRKKRIIEAPDSSSTFVQVEPPLGDGQQEQLAPRVLQQQVLVAARQLRWPASIH